MLLKLRDRLANLVGLIMHRVDCDASAAFQVSSFYPLVLFWNGFVAIKIDVSGCHVVDVFVTVLVVVLIDRGSDLGFKITRQKVVFPQDVVLQCMMPTLDLASSLQMIWFATRVV